MTFKTVRDSSKLFRIQSVWRDMDINKTEKLENMSVENLVMVYTFEGTLAGIHENQSVAWNFIEDVLMPVNEDGMEKEGVYAISGKADSDCAVSAGRIWEFL